MPPSRQNLHRLPKVGEPTLWVLPWAGNTRHGPGTAVTELHSRSMSENYCFAGFSKETTGVSNGMAPHQLLGNAVIPIFAGKAHCEYENSLKTRSLGVYTGIRGGGWLEVIQTIPPMPRP